ncbi:ABC transporter permease subunit [Paenibacillus chondroitinus]|uniref:ABC transporter permease subunit n=1 Tax=Paenibacillus chondroitinus TaxID=59842 RepID=A0ABU6DDV2_9BACL|nr:MULTISPECIES: ABC transporter permease subunit [Paenibacillus]MCY9659910.1 ABC transporter permease subunit [Paenibacillus anseongense]MEB4795472.1 ABC transporter permease subunit [Paenibacillus chondroitinus]
MSKTVPLASHGEHILITAPPVSRWRRTWQGLKRDHMLYLIASPMLLFFLIFKYVPMWGILIAFKNYTPYVGFWASPWVGFEHFERFFGNDSFFQLLRNTLAINLLNLIFFFPMPILLSLMLNEVRKDWVKRIIQSIIYLPHFLSWVIIVGITYLMLSTSSGFINKLIAAMGYEKIDFLTSQSMFWGLLTLQSIWKEVGWGTVIFLAAIASVDTQLFEAARMDGAGRLRQIWHVTLPAIRNVIIILLILRIGHMMDVGFEQVYLMMNGAVSDVADVFDTYVYRSGIQQAQFSYSTAVGLFKSIVGVILVVLTNRLAKKFGEDGIY